MGNNSIENQRPDLITRLSEWSQRYVPDAMVFVIALTILVYIMVVILTPTKPLEVIDHWNQGFWALLTFSMQMSLLMIGGFTVADSKPIKRIIKSIAGYGDNPRQIIWRYGIITCILWYIHWGLGMMIGIMLGREIAIQHKGKGIHYPILASCAYVLSVTANGPSMAAQLIVATPGNFVEHMVGVIPLSETTFDIHLIVLNIIFLITAPFLLSRLHPNKNKSVELDEETYQRFLELEKEEEVDRSTLPPAKRWDRSPVLMTVIGLAGLYWVIKFWLTKGIFQLDIDSLNFMFIIFAILLHRTPHSFIESVKNATGSAYGVIIQFPFYAGIFGMISFSGLAEVIAGWFIAISTAHTFPWIAFVYSGILNFFVPSGGSKFVVEAPYIIPAAQKLGANINYVINAYTSGDTLTNLLQPFWALPILGAFNIEFRHILPYGIIMCAYGFVVISIAYLVFPLLF